jgi:sodium-dependent dicarboxylate transporter 2/3/5
MLSIAYSASIGGMSTLIGTPPNAIFASLSRSILDVEITFSQWIIIGLPISAISLVVAWLYMVNLGVNIRKIKSIAEEKDAIMSRLSELGRITRDEIIVAGVFGATAGAWITRGLFWQDILPMIDDSTIVMISAIVLFLIPSSSSSSVAKNNDLNISKNSRNKRNPNFISMSKDGAEDEGIESIKERDSKRLMSWDSAVTIPWGVLLLIGGGLALANAYTATNLDEWMAEKLTFLGGMNYLLIILVLVAVTIFTGEIVSNTATAALLIPISASLATSLQIDPVLLMVPITIATSFGFVMPVGTPPNAIVFASGYVTIPKMARAGLPLDIISIMMVTGLSALLVPLVWSP